MDALKIRGKFKRILSGDNDSKYKIICCRVDQYDGHPEPEKINYTEDVIFKGSFSLPEYIGQLFEYVGEWTYEKKYNTYSFSVKYVIPVLPVEKDDVLVFLRSVKGVGKVIAERVYTAFNDLSKIEDDFDLISSVKGMKESVAKSIVEKIKNTNSISEISKLLLGIIPIKTITNIVYKYEEKSISKIKNEPYSLVSDKVATFKEADSIAEMFGYDKTDLNRIKTGILYTAKMLKFKNSSIIFETEKLINESSVLLGLPTNQLLSGFRELIQRKVLIYAKKYMYLGSDFDTECRLSEKVVKLSKGKVSKTDEDRYMKSFENWKADNPQIQLADKQEAAVKAVGHSFLSVLTGGPGTGKTSTLQAIMDTYKRTFPDSNITLMAPTGLAAKRMTDACKYKAKTIHKALGLIPSENDSGFSEELSLNIDGGLIIIDEYSMVGIHLSKYLFDSIVFKEDTRIVVVGDVDQLPPVSPGSVLDDFITSGQITTTKLDKNFRQEAGSPIVDGAYAVNAGNTNLVFTGGFQFKEIVAEDIDKETYEIFEEVKKSFKESVEKYGLKNTFVLCPMRKVEKDFDGKITTRTLLSTGSLNPVLRDIVNPASAEKKYYKSGKKIYRQGDRVINLKNSESAINGDIGIIKDIKTEEGTVIIVDFDGTEVEFTPDKLKNIDLAYCITVHKSQGCEYASVIYPTSMTQSVMLQRNLLYTAITRAKTNFLAIGSKVSIDTAIKTIKSKQKRDLLSARIVLGTRENQPVAKKF